ncbi:nuclear transport factor 2 family protein [Fodinicola feengrottensis]|uniref:nuclear transport factor 2 family protein n=1 Tax=Fodinicola feengrottensis TaxID=435914 RepID=UPI0036F36C5A
MFTGPVRLTVEFGDIVEYAGTDHAVFAGRETGEYVIDGTATPLSIRTTRYFLYESGKWTQFHHHGSIDDPVALEAYQHAVGK